MSVSNNQAAIPEPHPMRVRRLAAACVCAVGVSAANAGGTINFGPDKSISVGFGLRTSYTSTKDAAPNGTSRSSDFNLDSARLYLGGSLNEYLRGTLNFEKAADDSVKILDGYGQFEFMPQFNVWAGRMLPPSDRANLSGAYYLYAWTYPGNVSQYPFRAFGRDDGVTVWGQLAAKHLVYSAGVYEGRKGANNATTANQSDNRLYAGRINYNFWDPEPAPAYYVGTTYFGAADILALGLVAQYQKDGVGNVSTHDDYQAWNVDLLMEKRLGAIGVLTLEGAYYKYDFSTAAAAVDVSGSTSVKPGKAGIAGVAFLFPQKIGIGKFQPFYRYQRFRSDAPSRGLPSTTSNDYGVNYVIDGANAKVSATYRTDKATGVPSSNSFIAGLQLQF